MNEVVAILNCFSSATGANLGQILLHCDGTTVICGDEALARRRLGQFVNAPLPSPSPAPPLKRQGR